MPENDFDLLQKDIAYIKASLDELKKDLEHKYVTKEAFEPVRKLVFGMVSIVLLSFIGAIVALVIKA